MSCCYTLFDVNAVVAEGRHPSFVAISFPTIDHRSMRSDSNTAGLAYELLNARRAVLEMLVDRKVTGLPVVDSKGRVVGVVSDYDMLALEGVADAQVCTKALQPERTTRSASLRQSVPCTFDGVDHTGAGSDGLDTTLRVPIMWCQFA